MHVILGTSAGYLPYTATTVASVCHHIVDGSKVSFHIMHSGDVAGRDVERFYRNLAGFSDKAAFEFIEVRDTLNLAERFSTSAHVTGAATYLRLYIPELFKGRVSRAIYLDSDLVVCRNLGMLYRQDMYGSCVAGVEDGISLAKLDSLWLPPTGKYANAGVLLLDLDALDRKEMLDRLDRIAAGPVRYSVNMGDQDLLALLFHDRLVYLDPHWNVLTLNSPEGRALSLERAGVLNGHSRNVVSDCLGDPFVIHYVGAVKPWTRNWYHDPLSFRWYDYARMTGYFDRMLEGLEERIWWLGFAGRIVDFFARPALARALASSHALPRPPTNYSPGGNAGRFFPRKNRSRLDALLSRNAEDCGDNAFVPPVCREGGGNRPVFFMSDAGDFSERGFKRLSLQLFESTLFSPLARPRQADPPGIILLESFTPAAAARRIADLERHLEGGSRLRFIEPGPVSSIMERCPRQGIPVRFRRYLSFRLDDMAFGFDAGIQSRFMQFLESPESDVSAPERERCRRAMDFIVANRLSISNFLPLESAAAPGGDGYVLVIDQGKNSPETLRGGVGEHDFTGMLNAALAENRADAVVVYFPRPDEKSFLRKTVRRGKLRGVDGAINPYALLAGAKKVYACNSYLGFEALMAGKRVVTFADAFYSGWGLTDDRNCGAIRRRERNLEEIFYALALKRTTYFSPFAPKRIGLERFLDEIVALRAEFYDWASRWK